MGRLINNKFISTILESKKSHIKASAWLHSCESLHPWFTASSHCVLTWWKRLGISLDYSPHSWSFSPRDLCISQRPHILILHWALGFQHRNFAWTQSDHSKVICPFLNWVVFLLLSCKYSLNVLSFRFLSGMWCANIFWELSWHSWYVLWNTEVSILFYLFFFLFCCCA